MDFGLIIVCIAVVVVGGVIGRGVIHWFRSVDWTAYN